MIRGEAMPGIIRRGLATEPVVAFGNAGRSVTDGVKSVRHAFIDRQWCGHLVPPVSGTGVTNVAGQGDLVLFSPSCQNGCNIRDVVVRMIKAPKRRM